MISLAGLASGDCLLLTDESLTGSKMESLLATRYAKARKIILICDNLNTHTKAAFYEAFRRSRPVTVRRIEFRYTPKHGSWLNAAEIDRSSADLPASGNTQVP